MDINFYISKVRRKVMKSNKYLAGIMTATMALSAIALPTAVYADNAPISRYEQSTSSEYARYGDYIYYKTGDSTVSVVEYTGTDANVVIPSKLGGYTVTAIDGWTRGELNGEAGKHPVGVKMGAFENNQSLVSVTIPDTVKAINSSSFADCKSLKSVNFGNSVETIDSFAFYGCENLKTVTLPKSVKEIKSKALGYTTNDKQVNGFSIYGVSGTAAEKYAKENNISFNSEKTDISKLSMSGIKNAEYTGKAVLQKLTLKNGSYTLKEGADYTIGYKSNVKVGKATVTVKGIGSYTGTVTKNFVINPAKQEIQKLETRYKGFYIDFAQKGSATGYEIQYSTNQTFKNAKTFKIAGNKTDKVTVSKLSQNKKYYVRVRSFTDVGNKTYKGSWSDSKSIVTAKYDLTKASVTKLADKAYTGKPITQKITVKCGGKTLKNGTDYTVSYTANKKIGTATAKIVGKGSYGGVINKKFKINPAKQEIQKLTAKSKAFYIDFAQKDSASGYELQYSLNSNFRNAAKINISDNKADKKTVSKLKSGKKYFVRVRSYTIVNGNKYYGAWSAHKGVTVKK